MRHNQVIDTLMNRKSIRKYKPQIPTDEEIETLARAAQQAPFAAQMCSLLLKKGAPDTPYEAPLLFTVCFDMHKLEKIMQKRGWPTKSCDLCLLLFGLQDAVLMAENLVIAAESLGMGSCFIGAAPYLAKSISKEYKLPERVFPIVQLTVGYPDENPPPRPRYPMDYFLFEDRYPELTEEMINRATEVMDRGYLAQDYYREGDYMVPLENGRKETYSFNNYSWTEHMGRKWGQWTPSPDILMEALQACGFDLNSGKEKQ
ncbi:MAG: nitroreductase family protein [candidate division Zixibacteria bacterium]|nr:nitroreductase family protein [candidate division Zixibacteria bacterium]